MNEQGLIELKLVSIRVIDCVLMINSFHRLMLFVLGLVFNPSSTLC